MAAMVSNDIDSLRVALAHLMFNITGIAIFYPIPMMRQPPMQAARYLGKATRVWRGFPVFYIMIMFVLLPMFFLGLSALFEKDSKGFNVLGSFIVVILAFVLAYLMYWCKYMAGIQKCTDCMATRERKRITVRDLPDDMEYLKAKVALLLENAGMDDEEIRDVADDLDKVEEVAEDDTEEENHT